MMELNNEPPQHEREPLISLAVISQLVASSYASTDALVRDILRLICEQLGLRTSFLTEIHSQDNRNHIRVALNLVGGCDLPTGVDLPLNQTFCSIITESDTPKALIVNDVRSDEVFGVHPAALASPHIGCFVGVPIMLRDQSIYGTLCAIDPDAQQITPQQVDLLFLLARFIGSQLDADHFADQTAELINERDRLYALAQEAIQEREALVAIAAHELKNPLAVLLGQAQLFQRRLTREKAIEQHDQDQVQMIVLQAKRLDALLSELLDVSLLDTGEIPVVLAPLELYALVEEVVHEMAIIATTHQVDLVAPSQPVLVAGDSGRLSQVVHNLIGNAIKYTPTGGTIVVTVAATEVEAVLAVRDTGIGLSEATAANLFRRFYRAPHAQSQLTGGFGIGLYVVKEIISRHNGVVTVESIEGKGSTFTVRLPLLATGF